MLTTFRRHSGKCPHHKSKGTHDKRGRDWNRCKCPIWIDGTMGAGRVLESAKTRNWDKAVNLIREMEQNGRKPPESPSTPMPVAIEAFIADREARKLKPASLKKYRSMLGSVANSKEAPPRVPKPGLSPSLLQFSELRGIRDIQQVTSAMVEEFRNAWTDSAISAGKKLERLRAFCGYCAGRGWIKENFATRLKPPIQRQPPTMPYTSEEMIAILRACEEYPEKAKRVDAIMAPRMRALVLLLRYSGLRIGDAASYPVDALQGDRLFLYTAKSGVPVSCKLPPFVVEALAKCPRVSQAYWFWTRECSKETLAGNMRRSLRRLLKYACIKGAHFHRFRDTFAVELLASGTPMERVSALLGHSSIKVTEKHYAPWVRARQEQLEEDQRRSWEFDPIAQAERVKMAGEIVQ